MKKEFFIVKNYPTSYKVVNGRSVKNVSTYIFATEADAQDFINENQSATKNYYLTTKMLSEKTKTYF